MILGKSPTGNTILHVLEQYKILPKYRGHDALVAAVYFVLMDKSLIHKHQLSKKLYPMLADKMKVDWKTVGTDIQYAINAGLERMEPEDWKRLYGREEPRKFGTGDFIPEVVAEVERYSR